jgi:hypothetical protein
MSSLRFLQGPTYPTLANAGVITAGGLVQTRQRLFVPDRCQVLRRVSNATISVLDGVARSASRRWSAQFLSAARACRRSQLWVALALLALADARSFGFPYAPHPMQGMENGGNQRIRLSWKSAGGVQHLEPAGARQPPTTLARTAGRSKARATWPSGVLLPPRLRSRDAHRLQTGAWGACGDGQPLRSQRG